MIAISNYDGDWDDDGILDLDDDYPMDADQSDSGLDDYRIDTDDDGYAERSTRTAWTARRFCPEGPRRTPTVTGF